MVINEESFKEFNITRDEVIKKLYKEKNDHVLANKITAKEMKLVNNQKHEFRISKQNKTHKLNL